MALRSELIAKISADASGFRSTTSGLKSFLGGALAGIGATIAGAFSWSAVKDFILGVADAGDAIDEMSQRTGLSAKSIQELQYAANLTGSSIEGIEVATRKMANTLYDAEKGTKTAKDALRALGLTYDDLKGKSPDAQLSILMERLAGVKDKTLQTALAQDIFGKSGTQLLPMLANGAEGLQKYRDEMARLGTMTDAQVRKAAEFQDAVDRLKQAVRSAGQTIAVEVLPQLQKEIDGVTDAIVRMREDGTLDKAAKSLAWWTEDALASAHDLLKTAFLIRDGFEAMMLSAPGMRIAAAILTKIQEPSAVPMPEEARKQAEERAAGATAAALAEKARMDEAAFVAYESDLWDEEWRRANEPREKKEQWEVDLDNAEREHDQWVRQQAGKAAVEKRLKDEAAAKKATLGYQPGGAAWAGDSARQKAYQQQQAVLQSDLDKRISALIQKEGSRADVLAAGGYGGGMGEYAAKTKRELQKLNELYGPAAVQAAIQGVGKIDAMDKARIPVGGANMTQDQAIGQLVADVRKIAGKVDKMAGLTGN